MRSRLGSSGTETATSISPSAFVQQGTVDWPYLARASVTASVSVLTRLSGGGVELWTAAFAQVLFGTIRLSTEGEAHINGALAKLHSFGTHGNLIYYGFGVKHIVRTLADSAEGMATLAICSSIVEVHSLGVSTQIVQEYAKLYGGNSEGNLMPSFRQWECLVNSCSGVLATSPFGSVVEFFMRFCPDARMCGDPKEVARALEGLARISSGLMKSMVLIGNSECGFLAAIAQWLLSLRVVIQNTAGDIVYPSIGADTTDYQLMVIYSEDQRSSKGISRTADTYYIDNIKELLPESVGADYLSGRVEWGNAITQTFGLFARKLFQTPGILGETIGSAARIYSIPNGTVSLKPGSLQRRSKRHGPEVSGRAFVDLACKILPELADSKGAMNLAVERSYDDACLHFEKAMAILKELCGCSETCNPLAEKTSFIHLNERDSIERLPERRHGHCLRLLVLTAIQLIRQMSTVASMPTDLYPKRRGLERLYDEIQKYHSHHRDDPGIELILLYVFDSEGLIDLAALVFGVDQPFAYTEKAYGQHRDQATVFVNGGLCFIIDSVIRLSSRAEDALRVHIVPGHIEWKQRIYAKVRDGVSGSPRFTMHPMILPKADAEYKAQMQLIDSMTARAVVAEYTDFLRMSYEIKTAAGNFFLGPGELTRNITEASSGISCSGKKCQPFNGLEENFLFTVYPLRLPYDSGPRRIPFDTDEKPNIILFGEHELARCTAMANSVFDTKLILQEEECIACCARRALMANKPHEQVIISYLRAEDIEQLLGRRHFLLLKNEEDDDDDENNSERDNINVSSS